MLLVKSLGVDHLHERRKRIGATIRVSIVGMKLMDRSWIPDSADNRGSVGRKPGSAADKSRTTPALVLTQTHAPVDSCLPAPSQSSLHRSWSANLSSPLSVEGCARL